MSKKSNSNNFINRQKKNVNRIEAEKKTGIKSNESLQKQQKKLLTDNSFSFWAKYSKYLPFVVGATSLILFLNAINSDFVNWDDDRYVTSNQYLEFTKENIKFYFTDFYFVMYIPFAMLSYMIDYRLVGLEQPWVYHLHNVILHLITTVLVFFLTKKLFEKKGNVKFVYAFFVALLFGVHPLHVQSVSWISERKDVLFSMYFVASLLVYLYYVQTKKIKFMVFSFVLFLFSLLSKTPAVILPVIMLVVDYYKRGFLETKQKFSDFIKFKDKVQLKIFAEKIPFLVLSVIFGLLAVIASGTNEPFAEGFDTTSKIAVDTGYSIIEKLVLMSYSLFLYFVKLFVPYKMSAIHPYPFGTGEMPSYFFVFPLFSIAFVAAIFWAWVKQKKEILLGLLFFVFNLILVLHIKNFIISEHYFYLPAIGISIIMVYGVMQFLQKNPKSKNIIIGAAFLYISILSYQTYQRNLVFKNSLTFWNDIEQKYPEVIVTYYNRGNYLQGQGDFSMADNQKKALNFYESAIKDYTKTLELQASNIGAFSNRGITYAKIGEYQKAVDDFNQVVKIDSTYGNVYSNRGNAYGLLGKWNLAIDDYNKALKLNPNFSDAFFNRGVALSNVNRHKEAIADFNRVAQLNPKNREIFMQRGLSYYFLDVVDSALLDFNLYLTYFPTRYNVLYYRALCYEKTGQKDLAKVDFQTLKNSYPQIIDDILRTANSLEAQADATRNFELYQKIIELYEDISKIDANHSVTYSRMGVIYGKSGNMNKAFELLNKAIDLDPKNSNAHADRGYAYFITGNVTKSLADYNKALELNPNDFVAFFNRGILYESQNNHKLAIADFSEAIKNNDKYAMAYYRRANVYLKQNDIKNACADWQKSLELGLADANNFLQRYCKQ
ncbi:MAG TPA: tetratricopeptide repeat protein [Bacteroidetes bacterium]|nr:tetratricopeptide repeat protein [Bacteroidota bacterium]